MEKYYNKSPEGNLNLSKDFDYMQTNRNDKFDLDLIQCNQEKFKFPKQSEEFSDLSSISDIENNFTNQKNFNEQFEDGFDEKNIKLKEDDLNFENDLDLNIDMANKEFIEIKENFAFLKKSSIHQNNNNLKLEEIQTIFPVRKRKRQKEDLDKTPLPVFDCIYCSNENVVFSHMIRENLSSKYLLGSSPRDLNKINTILSTTIAINNSIDPEAQQMRNFIIFHTDYIKKFHNKQESFNYFELNKPKVFQYQPVLKKKIFTFLFDNTTTRNSLLLCRLKSNFIENDFVKKNSSKNLLNCEMSPNFSNSNFNSINSFNPFANPIQIAMSNIIRYEEEILIKKNENGINKKIQIREEENFELDKCERCEENDNFDKNESFLKFLRFDLKRKINFEDIIWEEKYHDIWNPELSLDQENYETKDDNQKRTPSFLKILNKYYKTKNSHEYLNSSFNVNKSQIHEEKTLNIKNLSDFNEDNEDINKIKNIDNIGEDLDKNMAEASGCSIKVLMSNFFENAYDEKISIAKYKTNNNNKIANILPLRSLNSLKSINSLNSLKEENKFSNRNYSVKGKTKNHNHTYGTKERPMSLIKARLDSQDSLSNNSQSLFNSLSQFKTLVTNQSDNTNSYQIKLSKNKFEDVAISENVSFIKEKDFNLTSRLTTVYKKEKFNTENKNSDDSSANLKKNIFSSSCNDFKTISKKIFDYKKNFRNLNNCKEGINNLKDLMNHHNLRKSLMYPERKNTFLFDDHEPKSILKTSQNILERLKINNKDENKIRNLNSPHMSKINFVESIFSKKSKKKNKSDIFDSKNSMNDLISIFKKKFRSSENKNCNRISTFTKSTLTNSRAGIGIYEQIKLNSKDIFRNKGKEKY